MAAMATKVLLLMFVLAALLSIRIPNGGTGDNATNLNSVDADQDDEKAKGMIEDQKGAVFVREGFEMPSGLKYDFYGDRCLNAEKIVRSTVTQILAEQKDTTAALLRMLFHDCFIQGCDASVLLDDSNGNSNKSIERQAVPNKTLKGFDKIDRVKLALEKECPGVVSCADILVLATRDSVALAGGPFYPVFTGRRDSTRSYFDLAMAEIPKPDDDIDQILNLFSQRGFSARETVSLLGAHNVGQIGCAFIQGRLSNFKGTGGPDPTIDPNYLSEMRRNCQESNSSDTSNSRKLLEESPSKLAMTYSLGLSAAIASGTGFDTHYYQKLKSGRGLLYADQQLIFNEKTKGLVHAYAADEKAFRMDFARVMAKMSNLNVLTGSNGVIRLNCSMPVE